MLFVYYFYSRSIPYSHNNEIAAAAKAVSSQIPGNDLTILATVVPGIKSVLYAVIARSYLNY